jgi:hypothetical protein
MVIPPMMNHDLDRKGSESSESINLKPLSPSPGGKSGTDYEVGDIDVAVEVGEMSLGKALAMIKQKKEKEENKSLLTANGFGS